MKKFIFFFSLLFLIQLFAQKRAIRFEDMFSMKRVGSPVISPDGKYVVFTVKEFSIEKNRGQSDLYLLHLPTQQITRLTQTEYTEFNPIWNNESTKILFLGTKGGKSQIYSYDLKTNEIKLAATIPVSVTWIHWAKDNSGILFTADLPAEGKTIYEKAKILESWEKNPVKAHVTEKLFFRAWNQWRDNLYSQLFKYDFRSQEIITLTSGPFNTPPLDLGGDHDICMDKKGKYIYYVANKTAQPATNTNNDIFVLDLERNEEINVTIENKANDNNPLLSPNGKYLAYRAMKRPGFEADQYDLILKDLKSGKITNLTGSLDLTISHFIWSPDSKRLYFTSPYHGRYRLYSVDRKGGLTLHVDGVYMGAFTITPNGKTLIIQRQAVNRPTELYRYQIKSGKWQQLTHFNDSLLKELEMPPLEEFWISGANGDSVHVLMLKPPFFDPSKKYPLIVLIHGGPQGAFGDDFHYRWNMEMFAAPGYVVIAPNFHGSRGYGQKFCDAVSKNWGAAPYEDIIKATQETLAKFDFISKDKIGAAGASYGGFMIDWLEGHNPNGLFKCFISHAGVFDQRSMYGATEELWFPEWEFNGTPYTSPELYEKYSPSYYVRNFNTPCLVICGEHDYRVPYTQSLQFFTALQRMGVESKLIVFPDEDHFVQKPQNAKFWWQEVYAWFEKYLK